MTEMLMNTIKRAGGGDFADCPEGLHVMGLISVKNCKKRKAEQYGGGEEDAFRFTFQHREAPEYRVFVTVNAKTAPNAALTKLILKMTNNKLNEEERDDPEALFRHVQSLVGKWFQVLVSHAKKNDGSGGVWVNVQDHTVIPYAAPAEWGRAVEVKVSQKVGHDNTGFESMPDTAALKASTSTGSGLGYYRYKLPLPPANDKDKTDKFLAQTRKYKLAQNPAKPEMWHSSTEQKDLEKYFDGFEDPPVAAPADAFASDSLADDDIPF